MMTYNELTNKYDVVDLTNSLKLSDLMSELPQNCIFIKGKTGCGGTTLALKSSDKYLIIMPYISNVRNKEVTKLGAFVYNGDYSQIDKNVTKICATYESLYKLMSIIDPKEWNLLIDEYHVLCNSYELRAEAFDAIKCNFKKFKSYCFMSATEPEQTFGFLKVLNKVEINWIGPNIKMPTIYRTMSVTNLLKSKSFYIENDIRQNDEICNNFIFYNSVKGIEKIIREFNITDYQVFMSEHNSNTTLNRGDIQNPEWKKYNFFTSTCFESVDIFVKNPKIWLIMNEKSLHTLIGCNTFKQIVGRFRGNNSLDITAISEIGDIKVQKPDIEEFKKQVKASKGLQIVADAMGESFSWIDYKQNFKYLKFRDGKVLLNVEAYESEMGILNTVECYKNYHFINYIYRKDNQDKITKIVTLEDRIKNIEEYADYKYYQLIKDCIFTIGIENTLKCKSIKAIKKALIDPNLMPSKKIKEELGLTQRFYSTKEIKDSLKEVGIYGSASRIKEFYKVKDCVKRVGNDVIRGYLILN